MEDTSFLTQRFGPEVTNYYGGGSLNRLSFLRGDAAFLASAWGHPSAGVLLLNNLAPLIDGSSTSPRALSFLHSTDVTPFTGAVPHAFRAAEAELIRNFDSTESYPLVVFLGLDESNTEQGFEYGRYKGRPYFALDVTARGSLSGAAQGVIDAVTKRGLAFFTQTRYSGFSQKDAAIYATARMLVDWNARNPFCAGCGQPTISVNAGSKRRCPPTDGGRERGPCPTRGVTSNLTFPRTDPTVIVLVVSLDGGRVLLGRKSIWPPSRYSTLAGFLEPGETAEDAVRREVWEESGVRVGRVVIHSTQVWPFPANLMIGAVAQALTEEIDLGHDKELEDARWFTLDEVRRGLLYGATGPGAPVPEGYTEGDLKIAPATAIANQLMRAVVEGGWGPQGSS